MAAASEPSIRFLALVSGPTVTAGEVSAYAALTTQGASIPADSPAAILDQVRQSGPSGFDPTPALGQLAIPSLWLYGALDQHVPTRALRRAPRRHRRRRPSSSRAPTTS